ncbi:hypothetical protein MBANPS3_012399 [Mucor bainieri]
MNNIQTLTDVPEYVKKDARRTYCTGQHSPPNTKKTALKSTPVLTHVNDNHQNKKEDEVQDKAKDEEDEIPSD